MAYSLPNFCLIVLYGCERNLWQQKGSTNNVDPNLLLTVIKIFCHLGTQNNKRIQPPWREQSAQVPLW